MCPTASHGVVIRGAISIADVCNNFSNLAFAGDIADHRVGIGKFLFQRADAAIGLLSLTMNRSPALRGWTAVAGRTGATLER